MASSRSRANTGQAAAAARLRGRGPPSPKWASATGASMPAAAQVAPRPGSGSTRATVLPVPAARQATAMPMIPAPITTTSWRPSGVMVRATRDRDVPWAHATADRAGPPDWPQAAARAPPGGRRGGADVRSDPDDRVELSDHARANVVPRGEIHFSSGATR